MFEHASVMDPSFGRAFSAMANAEHMIGVFSGSEDHYEQVYALLMKALERDDRDADAYARLAYICPILGRDEESNACVEKSLAINPNNPSLASLGGWVHVWRGQFDQALASAERGIRLIPW
ncbi:MAG: hypothetical protein EXQ94_03200 [Alphaproteobacteria bacterium]|nr:hypothetical protein [Alphaproteobacteria bacterium]